MILLFMSKELFKGNRALVSFIANLIMFCIPTNSTDTSDQKVQYRKGNMPRLQTLHCLNNPNKQLKKE